MLATTAITSRSGHYGAQRATVSTATPQAVSIYDPTQEPVAAPATVYALTLGNADPTNPAWLFLYDTQDPAGITLGSTPALLLVYLPPGSSRTHDYMEVGVEFPSGLCVAVSADRAGSGPTSSTAYSIDILWTTAVGSGARQHPQFRLLSAANCGIYPSALRTVLAWTRSGTTAASATRPSTLLSLAVQSTSTCTVSSATE